MALQTTDVVAPRPSEVEERVVKSVRQLLPRSKAKQPISGLTRLRWELGFDSMQLLELTFLLEEEFKWRASDFEYTGDPIETVGDVVAFVSRILSTVSADGGN